MEGRAVDGSGRPLVSVVVTVERPGMAPVARTTTGADGEWHISDLDPGLYRVTASRPGYRASSQDVQVEPGRTVRLTFVLAPAVYTLDSLLVSAAAPSISTTSAELGTQLTVAEIALLPTTLDARQLIALTPGARPDQIWGGASDQANSYALDGTMINHTGLGGPLFLPSPTWIETLAVRGLGAGAEVGGAQGGLVDVVTREGGNVLAGLLRMSFESRRLNGTNLIPGEIGRELSNRRELDGQVRGPLVHDRLHFAVFGHVIQQDEQVPNQLPAAAGALYAPPSLEDRRWLAKMSWKPGGRDQVEGSLMGRHQAGDRVGQTGYEVADATSRLRQWSLVGSLSWRRRWSPHSALSVRLGGFVARERLASYGGTATPSIEQLATVNPPHYQNAPFQTFGAPSSLGGTVSWTGSGRVAGVEHELTLGGEYTAGSWYFVRRRNGGMTWRPRRVLGFDPASPPTWVYLGEIATQWGGEVTLDSHVRNAALFAQEHLGILPWLRINPGIRLGWWTGALIPAGGGPRFTAVRDHALEPRIGVIADLDRRGGLVAKVHWGRYHQAMFADLFDRAEGGNAFSDDETWSYLGPAPVTPTQTFTRAERDSLAAAGLFRFDETVRLDQAGRVVQYHQPYVDQAMLSLERAFGNGWRAGVVYIRRRNRNMVALVDRNMAANYTVVANVMMLDRFSRPIYFGAEPLVLERVAISNEDILRVRELQRQGVLLAPGYLYAPPGLSAAELAALRYEPDFVLTNVPQATRRFEQFQVRLDGRYRTWWVAVSATLSTLVGNFNVVTGPDDYTTGGPGPWVRMNEQYNFFGALNNQSRLEGKVHLGGLLPARLRGGVSLAFVSGDRVTPTMPISALLTEFAVAVPGTPNPAVFDTLPFHPLLFRSVSGHRIFIQPRGAYKYEWRASLDLHLERTFARRGGEVVVLVDAFNILGDKSVTGIQTEVNAVAGLFGSDYGRVRSRVPPRTLRLAVGMTF